MIDFDIVSKNKIIWIKSTSWFLASIYKAEWSRNKVVECLKNKQTNKQKKLKISSSQNNFSPNNTFKKVLKYTPYYHFFLQNLVPIGNSKCALKWVFRSMKSVFQNWVSIKGSHLHITLNSFHTDQKPNSDVKPTLV